MAKFIEKAAVVAEIERRRKINKECMLGLRNLDYYQGKIDALSDAISFLDTLEVKEVDLELNSFDATVCKIGSSTYLKEMDKDSITKALEPYKDGDKVKVIIKTQEGE